MCGLFKIQFKLITYFLLSSIRSLDLLSYRTVLLTNVLPLPLMEKLFLSPRTSRNPRWRPNWIKSPQMFQMQWSILNNSRLSLPPKLKSHYSSRQSSMSLLHQVFRQQYKTPNSYRNSSRKEKGQMSLMWQYR